MPIFYPPEWLQQQVTGPNPSPNLGSAFDSFLKMGLERQQSAQDTLKMLLQSVPEQGGQRAQVAGSLAANPEVMGAMDPSKVQMFRKRGAPSESETVTKGFSEAYRKLPNKAAFDPAQLRQTIESLSTAARESGIAVKPEQISGWAQQVASGQMPQEPEFFGMMTHPQTKHLGLEVLYGDLLQKQAAESGKMMTPEDVLAARKKYAEASTDPAQMALIRSQALQLSMQAQEQRLTLLKEQVKALTAGAKLDPDALRKYQQDEALVSSRLTAVGSMLKNFDAAAKGDVKAQQNIMMTLSALSRAGDAGDRGRYLVLFQNAVEGNYTPEMRGELERAQAGDTQRLDLTRKALQSGRAPVPAGSGAAAGAPAASNADEDMADEILKSLTEP